MVLPLTLYNDPILRKKTLPIEEITKEIRHLADQMVEAMIHYNGVGLAGPQVGKLLSIFVIRDEVIRSDGSVDFNEPEVIINPILRDPSDEMLLMSEGCLSIPKLHADVLRPKSIRARYQKLDGTFVEEEISGFRARVFMHENDHLNGVLYIDRLSKEARQRLDPHLRSLKKNRK